MNLPCLMPHLVHGGRNLPPCLVWCLPPNKYFVDLIELDSVIQSALEFDNLIYRSTLCPNLLMQTPGEITILESHAKCCRQRNVSSRWSQTTTPDLVSINSGVSLRKPNLPIHNAKVEYSNLSGHHCVVAWLHGSFASTVPVIIANAIAPPWDFNPTTTSSPWSSVSFAQ